MTFSLKINISLNKGIKFKGKKHFNPKSLICLNSYLKKIIKEIVKTDCENLKSILILKYLI